MTINLEEESKKIEEEEKQIFTEIYILHKMGYKLWEIFGMTLEEKNMILKAYIIGNSINSEDDFNKKNKEIYEQKKKFRSMKNARS